MRRALESLAELRPATVPGAAEYLQAFVDYDGAFLNSPWDEAVASMIDALRGLA